MDSRVAADCLWPELSLVTCGQTLQACAWWHANISLCIEGLGAM